MVLLTLLLGVGCGVGIMVGAVNMLRLDSHGAATSAALAAMLPCSPGWLIGLPVGIWALVVLRAPEVKAAFRRDRYPVG
jgi:hypothetical protein